MLKFASAYMFKQISFSDEHKKLPAGQYTIKIYDDEAYTVLRKVNAAVIAARAASLCFI